MTDEKIKKNLATGDEISVILKNKAVVLGVFVGISNGMRTGTKEAPGDVAIYHIYEPSRKVVLLIEGRDILKKEKGVEMCSKACKHSRTNVSNVLATPAKVVTAAPSVVINTKMTWAERLLLGVCAALSISIATIYIGASHNLTQTLIRFLGQ